MIYVEPAYFPSRQHSEVVVLQLMNYLFYSHVMLTHRVVVNQLN